MSLPRLSARTIVCTAAAGLALVLVLVVCSGPTSSADRLGAADRTFMATIAAVDPDGASLSLDEVEVLSGDEAVSAAVEDGFLAVGEDLPNDVYVRDQVDVTQGLVVASSATVNVFDCSAGCELWPMSRAALLRGEVAPYGGSAAVWEVEVRDGMVAALTEVYLP